MKEYYLLRCGCLMTSEKINDKEYRFCVVLPRCEQSKGIKTDYMSDTAPGSEGYGAKLLTKLEATIEMLKG